ncbi:FRG domain-containing protein [Pseudoalteromonas sp. OOF1S-7]|uniref:FRG domain-containing protein n=1 Tax=Pseudoalteromonas sp. OOF1S-7 TaxID=2917757 RepID=UPI001EF52A78|nr:FRG domain-containing protein [Pseudoalteromonas sp. OOF1S-7]MCG7537396.1 FRG domain-containing protein [Pseudoalteromonas sp. OOF1S-7]
MARKPRWIEENFDKGFIEINLSSWKYFSDYINQEMLDYTSYVYRGHGSSEWKLEPTLDRIVKSPTSSKRKKHLKNFKYETRGRRGANPPDLKTDNDWWALGQHHGLATPLLDWTESPFVALYFAASVAHKENHELFSVFSLSQGIINKNNQYIRENDVKLVNNKKPTVKIVRPLSDENSRLVNQRGLFTRGPNNIDLETWIKSHPGQKNVLELLKINIPSEGVQDCLRYLNRMNINHSTLFPDLTGASEYCNKHLITAKY